MTRLPSIMLVLVVVHGGTRSVALAVPPPASDALFAKLDMNGDGALEADELPAEHRLLFDRLLGAADDGDGSLTLDEFVAALQPVRPPKPLVKKQESNIPGSDALVVLLARMDANGDRRLMRGEIPQELLPLFERMMQADANKNLLIEPGEVVDAAPRLARLAARTARELRIDVPAELAALPLLKRRAFDRRPPSERPTLRPAQRLRQLDKNGDGALSRDETPEQLSRRFSRFDYNQDQRLAGEELKAAVRALRRQDAAGGDSAPGEMERSAAANR